MKKYPEGSRLVGSWRTASAQSLLLFCYMTVQILCYTQLNARLNESFTRLDNLESLLSDVLSRNPHDDIRPRSRAEHETAAKRTVGSTGLHTYQQPRRIDVEAKLNELQRRIERLQQRANSVSPCNSTRRVLSSTAGSQASLGQDGGRHVEDGRDGATGARNDREGLAPPRPPGPKAEGSPLEKRDAEGTSRKKRTTAPRGHQQVGRAVYIRWGHRQCRPGTSSTLIYEGRMAGSLRGGGSNYLCAPLDPEFTGFPSGAQHHTRLHGVAYGRVGRLFFDPGISHAGVPCAVCRAPRASLLVIPALNYCPSVHWTREYHGFLMAQYPRHPHYSRTEYVCVDATARGVTSNSTRMRLTPVRSACATLPCPPYRDDMELTCAVCTS